MLHGSWYGPQWGPQGTLYHRHSCTIVHVVSQAGCTGDIVAILTEARRQGMKLSIHLSEVLSLTVL